MRRGPASTNNAASVSYTHLDVYKRQTWRHARILAMSMHEVAQVLVGRKGKEWWQQREQVAFPIPILAAPAEESKPEVEAPG